MKKLIQFGMLSNLLLNSVAFAVNPVQGFYVGLMGGMSHGPRNTIISFHEISPPSPNTVFMGEVGYDILGGGGGAMLGYKLWNFRLEGEFLYNRFSTGPLTIEPGNCIVENENILTPVGCANDGYARLRYNADGFTGSSSAIYGLGNLYYDFYGSDSERKLVPYVGIGIGQVLIRNFSNLVSTRTTNSRIIDKRSISGVAGQGILGLSYYLDDYTWAGMDLRYTTTKALPLFNNQRYSLYALMFNINFAFDTCGSHC